VVRAVAVVITVTMAVLSRRAVVRVVARAVVRAVERAVARAVVGGSSYLTNY
jgi:hypothetical protein